MKLYEKQFEQCLHNLDYVNDRLDASTIGLKNGIESTKNDLAGALSNKKVELEYQVKKLQDGYKDTLKQMEQKLTETESSLTGKFDSEVEQLKEHFQKMITQKEEAFNLTQTSLEKTKADLKQITDTRDSELQQLKQKNNETLNQHRQSIMSKLAGDEKKAAELEKEFNEVFKAHSSLGPEYDRQWRERQKKLKEDFADEDELYDADVKLLNMKIEDLRRQIGVADTTYQSQRVTMEEEKLNLATVYEKNIKDIINRRPTDVEDAKKKIEEEFHTKLDKLNEALANLRDKNEQEAEAMKQKINDKSGSSSDKLAALKVEQERVLAEFEEEKGKIKEEIENVKSTWDQDREDIKKKMQANIDSAKKKSELEEKYYISKITALRSELDSIITENNQVENSTMNDVAEYKKKLLTEENLLASSLQNELNKKVQAAVEAKIAELRKIHEEEQRNLENQMRALETQLSQLSFPKQDMESPLSTNPYRDGGGVKKTQSMAVSFQNQTPTSNLSSQRTPVTTARVRPSFATQQFIDSQLDMWRKDFLADTKEMRAEQTRALRMLDESKNDFQAAVDHINKLKQKLETTTVEYQSAVKETEKKSEQELSDLKNIVEEKEKQISELESQFEVNEHELKKRAKQIEAVEDKLFHLKEHLDQSKSEIQKKIKEEFQPLILGEKQKNDERMAQLHQIQNELELQLEFMKNDLFVVESANAAMEDTLRGETASMVERLKNDLNKELSQQENKYSQILRSKEGKHMAEIRQKMEQFDEDKLKKVADFELEMKNLAEKHQEEVHEINDYCMKLMTENSDKKQKLNDYYNIVCDKCPILAKHMKHLEKEIVKLQLAVRDVKLSDENNKALYKTFKPTLPPLNLE
ncbi:hypothetical protein TVAG_167300 [Trichomonas vaginalis G3]|uniref:Uncharacterized protein n=1 Tax=Trichomonas vaginalis (strain ATCC PRA-98 / G3) TaxID=412133 RepID=A2DED7_TRIV3|nr:hypothetical protein TVAGG3_0175340 [Trichomonas vaginalis G3]EAY21355.1 hypothetical protein TVAG_167300 [Trichomonas vaginalis G3]KAI5548907.1 hypothetical protein TVAGG3_0175340 [Trichomonas vaginalis G3]|eukprot:XP_001582341.1 hypothetical protein [Trichomonas vaginalis G3]